MFKKISLVTLFLFTFLINPLQIQTTHATENYFGEKVTQTKIPVSVFIRENCGHCHAEIDFLQEFSADNSKIELKIYDIALKKNKTKFLQIAEKEKISKTTPITLIGTTIVQGFDSTETTGGYLKQLITDAQNKNALTFEEYLNIQDPGKVEIISNQFCDAQQTIRCETDTNETQSETNPYQFTLPFVKTQIDLQKYSLGTMSVLLGFIDGFNPCAMWVLVTFLIVLVQIGDRKKMFQIAGIFILAEAIMYYLILNVWLTTWDFVGLDNFITPLVGIISLGGGIFFLYEFWTSDGTCKVTSLKQKHKTTQKINQLIESPFTWLTLFGVIGLAFSVNIIEFACSIGIPQAFTKILNLNQLHPLSRQIYLWIYTFFYMIDDFLVFGIALYSIEKIGITHKYAKYCNLIGGIAMLILGSLLIFQPTALMF